MTPREKVLTSQFVYRVTVRMLLIAVERDNYSIYFSGFSSSMTSLPIPLELFLAEISPLFPCLVPFSVSPILLSNFDALPKRRDRLQPFRSPGKKENEKSPPLFLRVQVGLYSFFG